MPDEIYLPKKNYEDASEKFARKYPHHHQTFFNRPDVSRRRFFEIAGAGLTGSYLMGQSQSSPLIVSQNMATKNTAKNVIFVLLTGAISQTDTWDLKVTSATPSTLNASMVNGLNWPTALFPNLGSHLGDIAIIRSMRAWALVHSLAQTWAQIGRNPAAALGDIAPNIGSVVAIEKDKDRKPGQVFPPFVGLNSGGGVGNGYLPATYAPFRLNQPNGNVGTAGIPNTTNPSPATQTTFNTMFSRLHQIDDPLRTNSPYGTPLQDYDSFYAAAKGMMYNPAVTQAFTFSAADSQRYGVNNAGTSFGNACLVAKQILAADQGTRFIQISFGSWDMHQNIYVANNAGGLFGMAPQLDGGLSTLIADLKAAGKFDETLIVVVGEFGRTVGPLSAANGRDHFLLLSALMAGGGVKGGKVIGATSSDGSSVADYGWNGSGGSGPRYVRPEDIESTIYSAMGIDWTTIRYDDPFKRGFEYVPFASAGTYGPVHELWS